MKRDPAASAADPEAVAATLKDGFTLGSGRSRTAVERPLMPDPGPIAATKPRPSLTAPFLLFDPAKQSGRSKPENDLDAEVRISLDALNGDLHAESREAHACPLSRHFRR
ncbi:hypothetical protein P3W85_33130 [Cupriavidus basilensis]|uniref:Uncharacterized protein n=1 Tax=Cupriavidus basilensis TaxID=68895 RepID=A0ABT6AYN7_9BURK|nr:hypothetical protein [Cupriavidus basilensis]MDF3837741.1 hypothetical protein [Cupriavidus basilensis]